LVLVFPFSNESDDQHLTVACMAASKDLSELLAEYKQLETSLHTSKSRLSKLAATQNDQRSSAERCAMFLEDSIGHSPPSLLDFYAIPFTEDRKPAARESLLRTLAASRSNPQRPTEYIRLRRSIDDMMEQIAAQQKLLNDEELAIAKLREDELDSRQREDQLYEKLMQEVHAISTKYETLHAQNKGKKRSLLNLQNSNSDLRKCIEQERQEIERSNEDLRIVRQQARKLAERRKILHEQVQAIDVEQIEKGEKEFEGMKREEAELVQNIAELEREIERKQAELSRLVKGIERNEDEIDELSIQMSS
jgi:chromosome segregation ATPase